MKRLLYILICCAAIAGCKSTSTTKKTPQPDGNSSATTTVAPKKQAKVEDFDKFYDRFHADSAFQMTRIKFPLKGGDSDVNHSVPWTSKNWRMMRTRIYDVDKSKYRVSYNKTATLFVQKVWVEGAGFSTECRFELIDGKWYLTFMDDTNF